MVSVMYKSNIVASTAAAATITPAGSASSFSWRLATISSPFDSVPSSRLKFAAPMITFISVVINCTVFSYSVGLLMISRKRIDFLSFSSSALLSISFSFKELTAAPKP